MIGAQAFGAAGQTEPDRPLGLQAAGERAIVDDLAPDDVDAARDHRAGTVCERCVVRRRVDAARQSRHDDEPGFAQIGREARGELAAKRRGIARADDRDHLARQDRIVSDHGDQRRRRIECRQAMREFRLGGGDHASAEFVQPLHFAACVGIGRRDELVAAAAELVKLSGRSVATVDEAKQLLWPQGGHN